MIRNRKQVLSQAKESIKNELWGELDDLLAQRKETLEEIEKETSSWLEERLAILDAKIDASHKKIQDWNLSRARKKKSSIQWTDDKTRDEVRFSKPSRKINWEVAAEVSDSNRSTRKNNSNWLIEGVMVFHKNDVKKENPMMVVDIFNEGRSARVLSGTDVVTYRSLSLREAFYE